jgi:hypothetical protein
MNRSLGLIVILMLLISGCSTSELLLKMKATQIEVYTLSNDHDKEIWLTITDSATIEKIITELNALKKTTFDDPESPGNLYEIHFIQSEKRKVFELVNKGEFESKIYTKVSAENGDVWTVNSKLAEWLLGDKRKSR